MTTPDNIPAAAELAIEGPPDQSVPAAIPDILKTMYLMGSHPAKMAAFLALLSFSPDEFVTQGKLGARYTELHEGIDGWALSPKTLVDYCHDALGPSNLLEFGSGVTVRGVNKNAQVKAMRLSERGRLLGSIVVGALWPLELQSLEQTEAYTGRPLYLQIAMGVSRYRSSSRIYGAPARFAMYDALLQHPFAGMPQSALRAETKLSHVGMTTVVQNLCQLGVLYKENDHDEKRVFRLKDELLATHSIQTRSAETTALLKAAVSLRKEGATQATTREILDRAHSMQPDLSRLRLSKVFTRWVKYPPTAAYMQKIKLSDNPLHRTRIRIPDEHQPYLQELLRIRQMLVEDSEEAEAFRASARQRAEAIPSSEGEIARVLAQAKINARRLGAPGAADWAHDLTPLIPVEGVDAVELHRRVVEAHGTNIKYQAFRQRLNRLPNIVVKGLPGRGQAGRTLGVVFHKKKVFPRSWIRAATCRDEDPDLFHPLAGSGIVHPTTLKQVETAKELCKNCPVLLPCLKLGLQNRDVDVVRGGVWFRESGPREVSAETARLILSIVEIRD